MSFIIQEQAAGIFANDIESSYYNVTLPVSVTTPTVSGFAKAVNLTSTTELLLFTTSNGVMAVIFDSAANAFGPVVLVRASVNNALVTAAKISSTEVLVSTLVNTTTALETVVLSVSGATITVNTPLATTLAANSGLITRSDALLQIGSSYVLCYARSTGGAVFALAFTVSGSIVTAGSETATTLTSGFTNTQTIAYSSSVFVLVVSLSTTAFLPISVSGTTLTLGTSASDSMSLNLNSPVGIGISTNNNILAVGNLTGNIVRGLVVTITGTVASLTAVNLYTASGGPQITASLMIGNQMMLTATAGSTPNVVLTGLSDVAGVATAAVNYYVGNCQLMGYDSSSGIAFLRQDTFLSTQYYGFAYAQFVGNDVIVTPKYFIEFYTFSGSPSTVDTPRLVAGFLSSPTTQTSLLTTTNGKQTFIGGTSPFFYSLKLNELPVIQQTVDIPRSNVTFRLSTLSQAQAWFMSTYSLSGLIQKVVLT